MIFFRERQGLDPIRLLKTDTASQNLRQDVDLIIKLRLKRYLGILARWLHLFSLRDSTMRLYTS